MLRVLHDVLLLHQELKGQTCFLKGGSIARGVAILSGGNHKASRTFPAVSDPARSRGETPGLVAVPQPLQPKQLLQRVCGQSQGTYVVLRFRL